MFWRVTTCVVVVLLLVACDQAVGESPAPPESVPASDLAGNDLAVPSGSPDVFVEEAAFTSVQLRADQERLPIDTDIAPVASIRSESMRLLEGDRFAVGHLEVRVPDHRKLPELIHESIEVPVNRGRVAHSDPPEETTLDPCAPFLPYTGTWGEDADVVVETFEMSTEAGEVCWLEIWGTDLIAGEFGEQTGFPVKVEFGDPLNLLYETRIENGALTQRIIHTPTGEVLYESSWTNHQPWDGPNA